MLLAWHCPHFSYSMDSVCIRNSCPAGTGGAVSDSGWSNSEIFQRYLEDHFSQYSIPATSYNHLLILYDGHKSHVSLSLIQWPRERNIILFVLPAHTSHILQPMDVGCFGPPLIWYAAPCNAWHWQVLPECKIACKAYRPTCALTPNKHNSESTASTNQAFCQQQFSRHQQLTVQITFQLLLPHLPWWQLRKLRLMTLPTDAPTFSGKLKWCRQRTLNKERSIKFLALY